MSSSEWAIPASIAPDQLARIQAEFSREWRRISADAQKGILQAPPDRRFSSQSWQADSGCLLMAHIYLLSARALEQMIEAAQVSDAVRRRLRFSAMQWVDAASPDNFLATNPDALQALIHSNGQTLYRGLANLLGDVNKGRMSQTDESSEETREGQECVSTCRSRW